MQNGHIFLLFLIKIIMNTFGYVAVHILRSISCSHGQKNCIIEKYFENFLDGYIIMRELRLRPLSKCYLGANVITERKNLTVTS